jgi:hypothetical protein
MFDVIADQRERPVQKMNEFSVRRRDEERRDESQVQNQKAA